MDFFLNSFSLGGQFTDYLNFFKSIKKIMTLRNMIICEGHLLFLDKTILEKAATQNGETFYEIIATKGSKDQKRSILGLFNKAGPFWDTPRISKSDIICFLYPDGESKLLSDTILQEAFEREEGACISFFPSGFCYTPLEALFYYENEPPLKRQIENFWEKECLNIHLSKIFTLNSWDDMVDYCERNFTFLVIERKLIGRSLEGEPFQFQVANTIIDRLKILNDFMKTPIGSEKEREIYNLYFKPGQSSDLFSSYKATTLEKLDVRKEHTFSLISGEKVFCPWHAKIKMGRQFRVHFTWPVEKIKSKIHIVYIGYKLESVRN